VWQLHTPVTHTQSPNNMYHAIYMDCCNVKLDTRVHTHTQTNTHTHTHTHTHTSALTHTHKRTHRHTCSRTRSHRWAEESLGPMPTAPNDFTTSRKNAHLERLEKKCAAVAAMAQKRLDTSAAIRSGWVRSLCVGVGEGVRGCVGR